MWAVFTKHVNVNSVVCVHYIAIADDLEDGIYSGTKTFRKRLYDKCEYKSLKNGF